MSERVLPTVGRVVWYRSATRGYVLPAMVTAVRRSLDPEGVARGDVAPLHDDTHVHLHVMTPGAQGSFTEWAVPYMDEQEFQSIPEESRGRDNGFRTWCWPEWVS